MMIDYNLVDKWYNTLAIKYELIRSLYNREMAVINKNQEEGKVTIRMLKCHNIQSYDFIKELIIKPSQERLFNYYYSLAKYKNGIPKQYWKLQERNNAEWTEKHWQEMVSYDFLLDIDAKDDEQIVYAYESTKEIKEFFDDKKIPYFLRFSGKGFHLVIPYKYLPQNLSFNPYDNNATIYKFCAKLGKMFFNDYSELVDWKIYDSRRICKIPYSLSIYPKEDIARMCFPFATDNQFKMFENNWQLLDYNNLSPELFKCFGQKLFNEEKINEGINELILLKEVV